MNRKYMETKISELSGIKLDSTEQLNYEYKGKTLEILLHLLIENDKLRNLLSLERK
jgi:hypothetical protein